MVTTLGWLYLVGGTVLFFFWAYGIVSFAFDCKNKFLPAARRLWAERRERREGAEPESRDRPDREPDREEERQLY